MSKYTKKQKVAVALGAGALAVAGAGSAFAYWTTTGSGSGSAAVATTGGTLTLHAALPAGLTPGQNGDVSFTADNANDSNLQLTTLKIDSITVTPLDGKTCASTNFVVGADIDSAAATQTISEGNEIAAKTDGVALSNGTKLFFLNSDSNQDGCKGGTVALNLSSS